MRILADENCDRLLVAMLRDAGHDVVYVAEVARSESDIELLRRAHIDGRAILTDDRDFGLLAERERAHSPAIILLRLDPLGRMARARRILEVLGSLGNTPERAIVVIEPGQVRRRLYEPKV
jgi:predicted nuclease of predicted toxin-antitoxin system